MRIKGLNRYEQIVDIVRLIAADKHLAEVRIFQNGTEGIKALLEDFFTVATKPAIWAISTIR